ncbi:MAG: carotenoid oxygenase family protein [Desulfuromonadales bacterium]|nr:carotenoid oxygenase family protein [Desulfuromonadales bacterium]
MVTRRQFLLLAGEAGVSLAVSGCAASPPLRKDVFEEFGDPARPYLGLATSLREEHSYEARIEGKIPTRLRGTLYRNGPGLFDRNGLRKRNLLDGDGMVQSFRFHDQGVHYRNRFVRTEKYLAEESAGRFTRESWSTQAPGGWWANFMAPGKLTGQASITVFYWRDRLYAFDECSLPYELDPDTLETSGLSHLGLPEGMTVYAAHAKLDPRNGEWLHFGVRYGPASKLHVTIFSSSGALKHHRELTLPRNVYMHDWFVSGNYLIFNLHPVEIDYLGVLLCRRSLVDSLNWRPEKGNLVMVLDREGDNPPFFLDASASYMWHTLNAYEEGGDLVADYIGYRNPDHFVGRHPLVSAVMTGQKGDHVYPGELRRYRIDTKARTLREETVGKGSYEWPRINEQLRCCNYRFGYMARARPGAFFWNEIVRIDMKTVQTDSYDFGPTCYCTEPVFIPLPGRAYSFEHASEPGFVATEVFDSMTRRSFLALFQAEQLASGPVAIVHLTHHVPFSYHGWWHPE